jgi:hypothetical protein
MDLPPSGPEIGGERARSVTREGAMNGTLSDAGADAILSGGGWTRSRRGNLTRMHGSLRLTVFRHHDRYRWCVAVGPMSVTAPVHDYPASGHVSHGSKPPVRDPIPRTTVVGIPTRALSRT